MSRPRCSIAFLLSALFLGLAACATAENGITSDASERDGQSTSDAAVDGPLPSDAAGPDATLPDPVSITLQAGVSNTITDANSIQCGSANVHSDNHYYRTYDLAANGVSSDFEVQTVHVGIESAIAGVGTTQPMTVRIHTLTGPVRINNMNELASITTQVSDQTLSILDVPIAATVPAGSVLVAEVFTPDGSGSNHSFFMGSNRSGEQSPSYLVGDQCNNPEPTPPSELVPGLIMSIVLNVSGTHIPAN